MQSKKISPRTLKSLRQYLYRVVEVSNSVRGLKVASEENIGLCAVVDGSDESPESWRRLLRQIQLFDSGCAQTRTVSTDRTAEVNFEGAQFARILLRAFRM